MDAKCRAGVVLQGASGAAKNVEKISRDKFSIFISEHKRNSPMQVGFYRKRGRSSHRNKRNQVAEEA